MTPNFVIRFTRGDSVNIDDYIDEWHNNDSGLSLHEYLGFSWDLFADFVRSNTIPLELWTKRLEFISKLIQEGQWQTPKE